MTGIIRTLVLLKHQHPEGFSHTDSLSIVCKCVRVSAIVRPSKERFLNDVGDHSVIYSAVLNSLHTCTH